VSADHSGQNPSGQTMNPIAAGVQNTALHQNLYAPL
jgi:hypothetical protein